jgi:flagellar biosynthetic protein FlhB
MWQEKTEPATLRRRKKAREEGQVARSAELVGSVVLLLVLWSFPGRLPGLTERISAYCVQMIGTAGQGAINQDGLRLLANGCLAQVSAMAFPVLGLVFAGALASNVVQVGLHFNPGQLQPKLSRLDPLAGLKRLLAARSAVELLKGVVKVVIVATSGWHYLSGHLADMVQLCAVAPAGIAPVIGHLAYEMAMHMAATLTLLAALDYAYQRWQLERMLRMTKQEVKDEFRETEGNPEIKSRIRQRQREFARRRMMADVPRASVVITNPSHYAVALKYALGEQGAPRVVAKGQDLIAQRIRELAVEHRVPLVENPPLARSIHKMVDVGEEIPPALYRAVAEVLALVWRLDASQRGR